MAEESLEKGGRTKKRFRRLKRLFVIVFVLVLALAAAWTIWLLTARVQYQAALDDLRQQDEPVTITELFATTLPDDQNAAVPFLEAIDAYNNDVVPLLDSLEEKFIDDGWKINEEVVHFENLHQYPALRKQYQTRLRTILKAGDAMQAKLIETQKRNAFTWDINTRDEMLQTDVFIQCLRITKYLQVCLRVAHDKGNDALALQYYGLLQNFQNAISSFPSMISLLFNRVVNERRVEMIEDIAPTLRIGNEPRAVSGKQVQVLIHSLLDETFFQECFRQAYRGERVFEIAFLQDMIDQKLDPLTIRLFHQAYTTPVLSTLCLPILYSDAARQLDVMKQEVYEPYIVHYSDITKGSHGLSDQFISFEVRPFFQPLSWNLTSGWSHIKTMYLHLLARRRMAAVALAIRLYEIDHGHWPTKLEDLVPKYLPAVPDDPFLPPGTGKIRYLPSANPPRLYSVGDNGTDEGGEYRGNPENSSVGSVFEQPDYVFFLKGKPVDKKPFQIPSSENPNE